MRFFTAFRMTQRGIKHNGWLLHFTPHLLDTFLILGHHIHDDITVGFQLLRCELLPFYERPIEHLLCSCFASIRSTLNHTLRYIDVAITWCDSEHPCRVCTCTTATATECDDRSDHETWCDEWWFGHRGDWWRIKIIYATASSLLSSFVSIVSVSFLLWSALTMTRRSFSTLL